jgi:murein L,D-transpeptidase YcbB/YkuD
MMGVGTDQWPATRSSEVNSKRESTYLIAVISASVVLAFGPSANAGLFGCGQKCQAKKAAKLAAEQQQQGYPPPQQPQTYPGVAPYPQTQTYDQQQAASYAAQQQAYAQQVQQQQQAYEAQQRAQQYQPQYQPQYQAQSQAQPYGYGAQPTQPTVYGYNSQSYGQLTNQDWLQFQNPNYNYIPTPLVGAAYDKTAYPVNVNEPEIQAIIQAVILKSQDLDIGEATVDIGLVKKFYALRGNQPAFIFSTGPSDQARVAKDFFANKSVQKGLDSRDYWSPQMESTFNNTSLTPPQKAGLDLLMVQSYIRLAGDLMNGRANPSLIDDHVMIKKRVFADYQALNNTLRPGIDQSAALESFEPQHSDYLKLEQALPNLFLIKSRGGWPKLSGVKILKLGVSSPDVPLLRSRLMELNILPYDSTVNPSLLYDATLVEAVKEFQWDHKLKPDGVIGPRGFAILNTSIDERIKEVRATLEKWRWMPRSLGNRYILVNIARQEMQLFENGQIVMSMKTVNGQVLRPTNILFDSIVSVDLNPYWNPPPSLILADIMPKQRANPNHMAEEHVKIFGKGGVEIDPLTVPWNQYINSIPPYQFREEPGINNSLGVVKFQTTNSSAIYLHDTNHREFFDQYDERFLSSGCIRLQHPLDLLQYLLRNKPEWTPEKIDQTLSQPNSYTHTIVPLGRDSIPFYVFYGTASFDDKGNLRFARDAYYLDERIVRAMTPQDEAQ